jgi:drug/metabolite transporter (DMT)-like permease
MKTAVVPLLLACQLISIAAQLCLKMGAREAARVFPKAPWRVALIPFLWGGTILYGFGTVAWLKILTVADLSFAYPFAAVAYTGGVLAGQWMLKERVTWLRWAGVGLIFLGLIFISTSGVSTAAR